MIYADYDFYCNEYFGRSISAEDFDRFALRGSQYLDYITYGKAEKNTCLRPLKMACCALAEQYQTIEAAKALAAKSLESGLGNGAEVQSETVGSWSRTYRAGGTSAAAALEAAEKAGDSALHQIAQRYLVPTGLLYRGAGRRCGL